MDDEEIPSKPFRIRVKAIRVKPERARLPARVGDYPLELLAVFVRPDALAALRSYAASDTEHELGGVLLGRVCKSSRRRFVEIRNFIGAEKGVSNFASFVFNNEAQAEWHRIKEELHPHEKIVGWFHTHPGYGIFLSSADQFADRHYYNEPYHVAIVIDPARPEIEIGAFVWQGENRVRVPLFES